MLYFVKIIYNCIGYRYMYVYIVNFDLKNYIRNNF